MVKKVNFVSTLTLTISMLFCVCIPKAGYANGALMSFPELVTDVVRNNPQIKSLEASLKAADYDVTTARWQFLATPSISSERVRSDLSDSYYKDGAKVSYVRLQQPLFAWGRIYTGLSIAQTNRLISASSLEEARQQVALTVVQAYADWMLATLRRVVYEQSKLEHEKFESKIKRRINLGMSPQSDYWLVKSRLEQLEGELQTQILQQENSLIKLSELLGQPISKLQLNINPLYS
jgi:adhesin transport system outer membrane protein